MKKSHILITILIVGSLILAGCVATCVATQQEQQKNHVIKEWEQGNFAKYTLPEDNVTCYTYLIAYAGGVSCIKDTPL